MELAIIGSNGSGTKHGSNDMRRMALAPKQWIVANSHLVSSATMLVRCRFGILTITQVRGFPAVSNPPGVIEEVLAATGEARGCVHGVR